MNLPLNYLPCLNGPKISGLDFAGTVLAAGPGTNFDNGDEVYGTTLSVTGAGCLTEVAHVNTNSGSIIKKPKHLSWTQAASLPLVYLPARTVIEKCKPFMKGSSPAEKKLVLLGGSSRTGIYTVQIAKSLGWDVLATCSGRNADFVRGLGASQAVDYTASSSAVADAIKKFSPYAIADCVGGTECIGLANQYVTIVGDQTSRSSMGGSPLYLVRPRMVFRWLFGYLGLSKSYECIVLDARGEGRVVGGNYQVGPTEGCCHR